MHSRSQSKWIITVLVSVGLTGPVGWQGAGAMAADIVIDDFVAVDMLANPWPIVYEDSTPSDSIYENVSDGVVEGSAGRVREIDPHPLAFDDPASDLLTLNVDTDQGWFAYDATAGASAIVTCAYGFAIQNDLQLDISDQRFLAIDFADLQLASGGWVQVTASLFAQSGAQEAESGFHFLTESGARTFHLKLSGLSGFDGFDVQHMQGMRIDVYATNDTHYAIDRISFMSPKQGDTNFDGVVNVSDLLALLANWGACDAYCTADFNDSASVNVTDLITLLANWD